MNEELLLSKFFDQLLEKNLKNLNNLRKNFPSCDSHVALSNYLISITWGLA